MSTLFDRRQKYCSGHDRGIMTANECAMALVELMLDADDDTTRRELCSELPEWFRIAFLERLETMEQMDFYCRSFGIGDARTPEQVHADALRQQDLMRELTPRIRIVLSQDANRTKVNETREQSDPPKSPIGRDFES